MLGVEAAGTGYPLDSRCISCTSPSEKELRVSATIFPESEKKITGEACAPSGFTS